MNCIEKIEWDPKYSVDAEEIDVHQKKLFGLFNRLIDMKDTEKNPKKIINVISDLNEYSKIYFCAEERYLEKKGYPDFGEHAKAHRRFTKRFIILRKKVSADIDNLKDVISELRGGLMNHILTMDSQYLPFLRIKKFIEKTAHKN